MTGVDGGFASSADFGSTFPPSGMRSIGIIHAQLSNLQRYRRKINTKTITRQPLFSTGFSSQAKLRPGERL